MSDLRNIQDRINQKPYESADLKALMESLPKEQHAAEVKAILERIDKKLGEKAAKEKADKITSALGSLSDLAKNLTAIAKGDFSAIFNTIPAALNAHQQLFGGEKDSTPTQYLVDAAQRLVQPKQVLPAPAQPAVEPAQPAVEPAKQPAVEPAVKPKRARKTAQTETDRQSITSIETVREAILEIVKEASQLSSFKEIQQTDKVTSEAMKSVSDSVERQKVEAANNTHQETLTDATQTHTEKITEKLKDTVPQQTVMPEPAAPLTTTIKDALTSVAKETHKHDQVSNLTETVKQTLTTVAKQVSSQPVLNAQQAPQLPQESPQSRKVEQNAKDQHSLLTLIRDVFRTLQDGFKLLFQGGARAVTSGVNASVSPDGTVVSPQQGQGGNLSETVKTVLNAGKTVLKSRPTAQAAEGAEGAEAGAGAAEAGAGAEAGAVAGEAAVGAGAGLTATGIGAIVVAVAVVVAALAALAIAIAQIPFKIRDWAESMLNSQRDVAEVSGDMAQVMARFDVFKVMYQQRTGSFTAGSAGGLEQSLERLMTTLQPYIVVITNVLNTIATFVVDVVTFLVDMVEELVKTVAKIADLIPGIGGGFEKGFKDWLAGIRGGNVINDATDMLQKGADAWQRGRNAGLIQVAHHV